MVICIGGVTVDFHAEVAGAVRLRSSNPGRLSMSPGGVARNIAENAARLGLSTALLSWTGTDVLSDWALEHTRRSGVDVRAVSRSEVSGSDRYLSVLESGEPLVSVSDFGAIESVGAVQVDRALQTVCELERREVEIVAADCNLGREALQACIDWCNHRSIPCIVDPVSIAKSERLYTLRGTIAVLTPNAEEATLLLDRRGELPDIGAWVVTRAARGAAIWSEDEPSVQLVPAHVRRVLNANGAGDAFVAGLIAGLCGGHTLDEAVRWGVAAGSLAVASAETVSDRISRVELLRALGSEENDEGDSSDIR